MLFRLIRVILAAIGAAVVVAVIYAVVDLYMAGHGMGWTPERGDPWYYPVFGVLMFVAAITAGAVTWWRRD